MAESRTLVTAEELAALAAGRRAELVRGEVIDLSPVGRKHSRVTGLLVAWFGEHVRAQRLGEVGTELGFILARDPDVVRAPDVHFVAQARLAAAPDDGYFPGPPDLAVEVLSPDDRASDVLVKVRDYLQAGTGLVLLVDPRSETVTLHRPTGEARVLAGADVASCEPVLPGLRFRVADLFRPA